MKRLIQSILVISLFCFLCSILLDAQTNILIFSYGSLVKQKTNKKTGALLNAGPFFKTSLGVPVSFTFLAGMPTKLITQDIRLRNNFTKRRATVTIDVYSKEFKPLWVAQSSYTSLSEALNNLAAREGAPFINNTNNYDLSHMFYIKKVTPFYRKKRAEIYIKGAKNWITCKAQNINQQLSNNQLLTIVKFIEKNNAQAAIWAALPSNCRQHDLITLLNNDPTFIANTAAYIQNMPPGNNVGSFEKNVIARNAR